MDRNFYLEAEQLRQEAQSLKNENEKLGIALENQAQQVVKYRKALEGCIRDWNQGGRSYKQCGVAMITRIKQALE